jgi:hypothetical protein
MPGHTGLPRNKAAEEAALLMNLTSDQALGSDVRAFLLCAVVFSWQDRPSASCEIICAGVAVPFSSVRKEGVTVACLQIGHTDLTRSHLLLEELAPICTHCEEHIAILHILIACPFRDRQGHTLYLVM